MNGAAAGSPAPSLPPSPGVAGEFPILARPVRGRRLVYLDNAATTHKPESVIEAEGGFYRTSNANIHRGVHWLSQQATDLYESARDRVRRLLNARLPGEIVFTRGTTEAINLVAQAWARPRLRPGDEVLVTGLEHHSNIVPWQQVCEQTGAVMKVAPITDRGELVPGGFEALLGPRTRLAAIVHVSNALGTVLPVADLVRRARAVGAATLVDGAQAVAHLAVDVQAIGCDFYAFSGHKVYGPTGIGALYGRSEVLASMPPWQGGGDMIRTVSFERSTYADPPQRFEAGTPNIAGAIGLAAAIDWLERVGLARIAAWEHALLARASEAVGAIDGVTLVGTARERAGVLSFTVAGIHPHDLGTILDSEGVAIRAGHHCAMPVMTRLGIPGTARASFAAYNDERDVEALVAAIRRAQDLFGGRR